MPRPKLITAPRILVYINSKLYGVVTSFTWTSSTPRKKIRSIDIMHPVELAATITEVTWNMGILRVMGDGGLQGAGVVAKSEYLSREKYFTILLVDRLSDLPLFNSEMNQVDSENWSVTAKGLLSGQVSGAGISWSNETNQQL